MDDDGVGGEVARPDSPVFFSAKLIDLLEVATDGIGAGVLCAAEGSVEAVALGRGGGGTNEEAIPAGGSEGEGCVCGSG